MKNHYSKIIFGLIIFLTFQSQIYGQAKSNYINLNYILVKLTFTSRINHSNEEINSKLIKEIQERKVDFILTSEDEKSLKEARATDSLIATVRENSPKNVKGELLRKEELRLWKELKQNEELKQKLANLPEKERFWLEAQLLYHKFLDNRRGPEIEKYKIAIEAGKEFIERYSDEKKVKEEYREAFKKDFKEVIEYVQKQLPRIQKMMNDLIY